MRQLWPIVLLVGSGCNSLLGIDELTRVDSGSGPAIDAAIDAVPDAAIDAPGEECFGSLSPEICFVPSVVGPTMLIGNIDTTSATTEPRCLAVMLSNGIPACAIVGNTLTVTGALNVTGTRPLILAAAMTLAVNGDIDVGSILDTRQGPGANPGATQCTAALPGTASNNGAGGGAGGSFFGPGNNGGNGPGGVGAVAAAASLGTGLHGGCPGSLGGASGGDNGPPGHGGGAIYLVAGTSITISRAIRASGGGGSGGSGDGAGGGGGGSGGMIVIESPLNTLMGGSAELAANGGGGGEGSIEQDNTNGGNGGQSSAHNVAGPGGSGLSNDAGNGGVGAIRTAGPQPGQNGQTGGGNTDGGGGGGGGGLGLIWYKGAPLTGDLAKVSPTAVQGS